HEWLRPVILVACNVDTQRTRLQERDQLTQTEAQKHIDAQMSLEEKRRLSDYVIENDGSLANLEQQVRTVLEKIKAT
ncbi:MAG TPA: dephospho-CoA kinase, partial [Candidatus Binatia bacterium]